MEKNKEKIKEYAEYIKEHVLNVQKCGTEFCKLLHGVESKKVIGLLDEVLSMHDDSKFSDEEFDGYRQWFYASEGEEKNKELFDAAFLHHYETNPHHWEHWVKGGIAGPMGKLYVYEMLCDWGAMSIKFKNKPSEWYKENKGKMNLHKDTKVLIKNAMPMLDKAVENVLK